MCSYFKKLFGSSLPSNSKTSTLKSLRLGLEPSFPCCSPLRLLTRRNQRMTISFNFLLPSRTRWTRRASKDLPFMFHWFTKLALKYSFWFFGYSLLAVIASQFFIRASNFSSKVMLALMTEFGSKIERNVFGLCFGRGNVFVFGMWFKAIEKP